MPYNTFVNQQTLIFLGPQGSGKGTQIELLTRYLQEQDTARTVALFGMGKALREFMAGTGYTENLVRPSMERGELQPLFLASALLADFLLKHIENKEHLIVDGFPREMNQIEVIDSALSFYKREKPTIIHITISDEEAVTRLLKRGRADDTPEGIRERLEWSRAHTDGVLSWFRANPRYTVLDINGERSIEEIQADIRAQLAL